jgi:hypothetical protein
VAYNEIGKRISDRRMAVRYLEGQLAMLEHEREKLAAAAKAANAGPLGRLRAKVTAAQK